MENTEFAPNVILSCLHPLKGFDVNDGMCEMMNPLEGQKERSAFDAGYRACYYAIMQYINRP